jgi:hypothetical protein
MAPCRLLVACLATLVVAHASVTIRWNTRAPQADPPAPQTAVVSAVRGTHVVLRMHDGSLRAYTATPAQAKILQALIGTVVRYRVQPR